MQKSSVNLSPIDVIFNFIFWYGNCSISIEIDLQLVHVY